MITYTIEKVSEMQTSISGQLVMVDAIYASTVWP